MEKLTIRKYLYSIYCYFSQGNEWPVCGFSWNFISEARRPFQTLSVPSQVGGQLCVSRRASQASLGHSPHGVEGQGALWGRLYKGTDPVYWGPTLVT